MSDRLVRPAAAFSVLSRKTYQRRGLRSPRKKSLTYSQLIASLPCIVSGVEGQTQAAHIRYAEYDAGKRETGMAERPSDMWVLPLHWKIHLDQHRKPPERDWWLSWGIEPLEACKRLWEARDRPQWMAEIVYFKAPRRREHFERIAEILKEW
ncbi:MAG: hypothetical protein GY952_13955 [Rhodobacteraceae bacterium]|nr:hypothetical protein [Paracoccaceae bacterium]